MFVWRSFGGNCDARERLTAVGDRSWIAGSSFTFFCLWKSTEFVSGISAIGFDNLSRLWNFTDEMNISVH